MRPGTRLALSLAIIPLLFGCENRTAQRSEGAFVKIKVPLRIYVVAAQEHGEQPPLLFPLLRIYSSSGRLVYSSHDNTLNASLLSDLPGKIKDLQPTKVSDSLQGLLGGLPGVGVQGRRVLSNRDATLVSISLDACHACGVQDGSLQVNEKELLRKGINIIAVEVSNP